MVLNIGPDGPEGPSKHSMAMLLEKRPSTLHVYTVSNSINKICQIADFPSKFDEFRTMAMGSLIRWLYPCFFAIFYEGKQFVSLEKEALPKGD